MAQFVETLRSVLQFQPWERDADLRRLRRAANVDDLRAMARRRLPRGVFDYIDGGADAELSLGRNSQAFRDLEFQPRVLRDVAAIDISSTLLGKPVPAPFALAPTGFTRIADPQGELAVARAAARAQIPYTLSTLSTRSIEEVAAVSQATKWFQVYMWRDRSVVKSMLDRAAASGYDAAMLTVDTGVFGKRDRDARRGFALPPKIGPSTIVDGALHPRWTLDLLRNEPILFANLVGADVSDGTDAIQLADISAQFDQSVTWDDIEWLRNNWNGSIILKGIQTVADAKLAAEHDLDAIALSNHGGRQLDGSPAPITLVRPVAEAVGGQIEIICDGGIRRGSDIVKAIALGATACTIGRAYLYGLAAAGERGVDHVIAMLQTDMIRTMALIGASSLSELSPELIAPQL